MKTSYRVLLFTQARAILGRRFGNLIWIVVISTLSLTAIGLGNGVRIYLRDKMDSPFVRFVNVTIPFGYADPRGYWADLDSGDTPARFLLEDVTAVHTGYAGFLDAARKPQDALVSDIHQGDALYQFLTAERGIFLSNPADNKLFSETGANGWGCIVTKGYLQRLGLAVEAPYLHYKLPGDTTGHGSPIPICGVVRQLPNFIDVLVSEKLLQAINQKFEPPNPLDITASEQQHYLRVFVPAMPEEENEWEEKLNALEYRRLSSPTHVPGIVMEKLNVPEVAMEFEHLQKSFPEKKMVRAFDYGRVALSSTPAAMLTTEYITIAFERLDSVRAFQDYLGRRHQLKIDMREIEAAENFRLLEGLIGGLSLLLVGFSGIAVILFVSNVVTSYLDKQRRSLGTLKAFGLSDGFIIRLYAGISVTLLLSGFLMGLLLSHLLGCGAVLVVEIGMAANHLDFIQWPLYWLLPGFVVLPAALIAGNLYIRLRGKSPGDLVYERD